LGEHDTAGLVREALCKAHRKKADSKRGYPAMAYTRAIKMSLTIWIVCLPKRSIFLELQDSILLTIKRITLLFGQEAVHTMCRNR
jgi:hypothetical protein